MQNLSNEAKDIALQMVEQLKSRYPNFKDLPQLKQDDILTKLMEEYRLIIEESRCILERELNRLIENDFKNVALCYNENTTITDLLANLIIWLLCEQTPFETLAVAISEVPLRTKYSCMADEVCKLIFNSGLFTLKECTA